MRGNPSKRVGFPSKTVHWTVFSPHPALMEAKEFRALRGAPGALPLDPTTF